MATKRRYYAQNVQVTKRDRELIRYIAEHGCASFQGLYELFWPGRREQTCKDRLDLLWKAGYIHRDITYAREREEIYFWIEKKGGMLFSQEERQRFALGKPPAVEIAHILHTNDIIERLRTKGRVTQFIREHALKSMKAQTESTFHVADAEVTMEINGHVHSFLVEIDGKYFGTRLREKVHDYGASGRPVLWVVYTKERLSRIKTLCKSFLNIRPVLYDAL